MLEIVLDKQADKFLRRCEKILFDRVVRKLEELKINPIPHDSKRMQGYIQRRDSKFSKRYLKMWGEHTKN